VRKTKPIVQLTHVFLTCSSIANHHAFMAKYTFKKSSKVLDSYIDDKFFFVHLGSCSYLDFLCVFLWTSFGEVNMLKGF
jgi:hypothetical protein